MKHLFTTLAVLACFASTAAADLPVREIGSGSDEITPREPYCQTWDRTLSADTVYVLTGLYYVEAGNTLTIEAGTIIKGHKATQGTLIVTRGAQIFAQGTQQNPIVFTSNEAPGARAPGDWGGVIILGDAPCNKVDPLIEGGLVPGSCSGGTGTYGGNDASDNSGVFSYVRIEFPGFRFALDNEVNGLTMGGVGSGTQIDHVQVSYSFDDSFEWFGGTTNCSYLVAFGGLDDEFDTDFGYRGNVQFGFGLKDPNFAETAASQQTNGFESDNDGSSSSTATPYTRPIFCNMTLVGAERTDAHVPPPIGKKFEYSAVLRRSTQTSIYNSLIMGYPWGLAVRDPNTITWANDDTLQVRNVSIQARLAPSGSTHIHQESAWAGVDTWFGTSGYNNLPANSATRMPNTIGLNNMSNLNAPDPRPADGSELIGSADFSNPRLASFVATSYRGAFPPVNGAVAASGMQLAETNELWTYYWTNFDPQNTDYDDGLPTAIGGGPEYASYLSQNYPNPFNPQTTIDFVVPATGTVALDVFDARGAKVASLVNGVKAAGKHTVSFNAQGLASGVYFYRLKGNGFNEMRKMVLLK